MKPQDLFDIDARVSARLMVAEHPGVRRTLAAILAHSGDSWFWGVGLVLTWWLAEDPWKGWAVRVLGSIAGLAILVMALKLTIRRARPEGEWGAIYRRTDPHSFPSGHAARAVMLAVLVLGWGPSWLAPWLIVWAPLVALSRVAMGLHYLSDVLAGVVIGLIAALPVVLLLR